MEPSEWVYRDKEDGSFAHGFGSNGRAIWATPAEAGEIAKVIDRLLSQEEALAVRVCGHLLSTPPRSDRPSTAVLTVSLTGVCDIEDISLGDARLLHKSLVESSRRSTTR